MLTLGLIGGGLSLGGYLLKEGCSQSVPDEDDEVETIRTETEQDRRLREFGESLEAPKWYQDKGYSLADKLYNLLKGCSKFFVIDYRIGGSFGKKTDVLYPDLDLIIVVNKLEKPPYEEVLIDFEKILLMHEDYLEIRKGSVSRKSSFSLQFAFQNGISVDLVPAANLDPPDIYAVLERNPEKYYEYSSSLSGRQLAFMQCFRKRKFIRTLTRLVKFWLKTLSFGEKWINGGCTIIELLCIAAVNQEKIVVESESQYSILRCFHRVIIMILDFDNLKLAFCEVTENEWIQISERSFRFIDSKDFIPYVVGTNEIFKRKCFIIEPANPFNNLLDDQEEDVMAKLKEFASVTRKKLEDIFSSISESDLEEEETKKAFNLVQIFLPQPTNLKAQFPNSFPSEVSILCGFSNNPTFSVTVQNETLLQRKEIRHTVEAIKWNMLSIIKCMENEHRENLYHRRDYNFNLYVQKEICNLLESSLGIPHRNKNAQNYSNINVDYTQDDDHEDDITLTIPYITENVKFEFTCSMTWIEIDIL